MPMRNASYLVRSAGSIVGSSCFGGACIFARTSSERVSSTLSNTVGQLRAIRQGPHGTKRRLKGRASKTPARVYLGLMMKDSPVDVDSTSGRFNTLLLSVDQFSDVAIHRVLHSREIVSARDDWWSQICRILSGRHRDKVVLTRLT